MPLWMHDEEVCDSEIGTGNRIKEAQLIYALCCLWNFLRKHETLESLLEENEDAPTDNNASISNNKVATAEDDATMKIRRD